MRIPSTPIDLTLININLTHGYSGSQGVINIELTLPINRTKYFAGSNLIECLPDIPNFKPIIETYVEDFG